MALFAVIMMWPPGRGPPSLSGGEESSSGRARRRRALRRQGRLTVRIRAVRPRRLVNDRHQIPRTSKEPQRNAMGAKGESRRWAGSAPGGRQSMLQCAS